MEVVLLSSTFGADRLCAQAMMGCQSIKAAFELNPNGVTIRRMIKMAIESGHESVLEHAVWTFSVKGISRACSHQLVRHRIASYSQQSQRHVNPTKVANWYVIPPSMDSTGKVLPVETLGVLSEADSLIRRSAEVYAKLLSIGVPEEDARFILPNACKTNIVITMNGRELRHFFKLRRAKDAQWEIREMANKMFNLCTTSVLHIFDGLREVK